MKHTNKSSLYIISSLTITTLILGLVLSSALVSADNDTSVVDEINITIPVSCTLSGTGMNTHNAEINNGQYNSAIGETTMKAFCNDNNGFAIYAIGYTDNEDGKNVLTNSTLGSTYDIETGTAITGNDSQWAMKLSTITNPAPTYPIIIAGSTDDTEKEQGDPDYTSFQEVPDDYTLVAKRTAGTDIGTSAEGSTLTTTYQAYISPTQSAGTYTGQVKYTLVHPHNATAPIKPLVNCNPSGTTISDIICMQDIDSSNKVSILASMTESIPHSLYDSRDGQQYNVAKLVDGNIWMLDNLALDPTDTITAANLSQYNTNAPDDAIANLLRGGNTDNNPGWTSEAIVNKVSDWNSISPNNAYEYPYINNVSKDTVVTSYGDSNGKVGVYYNICAATMGTYCYPGSGNQPNPIYDLCPANWRIPSSTDIEGILTTIAGSSQVFDPVKTNDVLNALSLSLSGSFQNSSANEQNTIGTIYTRDISPYTIILTYENQYILVVNSNRGLGYSVRCVLNH
ncbi:hypothetical protein IKG49_01265 [Candidatus Saccharibacteria bacterium]|nr:hypothetical protein [Candidatus Saccharibacteria bacterium]